MIILRLLELKLSLLQCIGLDRLLLLIAKFKVDLELARLGTQSRTSGLVPCKWIVLGRAQCVLGRWEKAKIRSD